MWKILSRSFALEAMAKSFVFTEVNSTFNSEQKDIKKKITFYVIVFMNITKFHFLNSWGFNLKLEQKLFLRIQGKSFVF